MDRELISRIDARRSKEVLPQHGYDGELLQLLRDCKAALSKEADPVESSLSVEEFIAAHTIKIEIFQEPSIVCRPEDLRAWMAGHARVPVDILGISEFALRRLQFDTPKNGTDYELITRALNVMLTASKERTESASRQENEK